MTLKKLHDTRLRRGHDNAWRAEDTYEMHGARRLRISTHKTFSGRYVTVASSHVIEGHFETFVMYVDFYATLEKSEMRGTEKNVLAQHQRVDVRAAWNSAMKHYDLPMEASDAPTPV